MSAVSEYQPDPVAGGIDVINKVVEDFYERAEAGKLRYGTYLQTHNGRDALMDAYQESIDLVMYLKQALLERDSK